MNDKRPQGNYIRPSSLNEVERKRNVDKLNFENKLMSERLRRVPPVISTKSLEEDFERHLKAEANLRRRQMKPMGLPRDLMGVSHRTAGADHSLFDSSTYSAQQMNYPVHLEQHSVPHGMNPEGDSGVAIRSMTDFRRHVISVKKQSNSSSTVDTALLHRSSELNGHSSLSSQFEIGHRPQR